MPSTIHAYSDSNKLSTDESRNITRTSVGDKECLDVSSLSGVSSSLNSTTSTLSSGSSFTGTGEQNNFPDIMCTCYADVAGTLYFEFSDDDSFSGANLSTFPVNGFTVSPGVYEFHIAVKGSRYFRVRYVNGSTNQSTFRLNTYFGTFAKQPNAPLNQSLAQDADAITVRTQSSFFLDTARGINSGYLSTVKFGAIEDAPASERDLWLYGGSTTPTYGNINYPWPITTETLNVVSSSPNDDGDPTTSTGAQTVVIEGLDSNLDQISETVTLNGTSNVLTSNSYFRVNRMYVATAGTYTGTNEGRITATNSSGGQVLAFIAPGRGQTEQSMYTVPAGYSAYVFGYALSVGVGTNKDVTFRFWQRQNADDVTQPYGSKRLVNSVLKIQEPKDKVYTVPRVFPEKTDLWWSVLAGAAASSAQLQYDIVIVSD